MSTEPGAGVAVHVNGEAREVPAGTTIVALVRLLGAPPEGVAVALNAEVIPRAEHGQRVIVAGDRVEVIRAVGGG
ncbi:MAG: sulfur carrier protein ThiS [Pseudomonadota bacterium]|nr:sulfur carrier protein ThiS [Pseudomonadota bacterium]